MDIGLDQLLFLNEVHNNLTVSDLGKIALRWAMRIAQPPEKKPLKNIHLAILQIRSYDGQHTENTDGLFAFEINFGDGESYSREKFNNYAAHIIKKFPHLFS